MAVLGLITLLTAAPGEEQCTEASGQMQQANAGFHKLMLPVTARDVEHLPADASPADLARYLATITQGMAVRAAGGATRAELLAVADLALRAWPL